MVGVKVNVRTSSVVDRGFESGRAKPKTEISICCLDAKHATLMNKIKDWFSRNQNDVS